jgi:hypothetical protein
MKKNHEKNGQGEQEPRERDGSEAKVAEAKSYSGIALIRKTKQKGAGIAMKDTSIQASPEEIKKQQEDADRVMKELLEEEQQAAVTAAAVSQKKKHDKGRRGKAAHGQGGIKKEEQKDDSERTEAKDEKKAGDQGASASKPALRAKQANEAGVAAAGAGVEARSWSPPLQADVEQAAITMSAASAAAELLFMSKFNFSPGRGAGEIDKVVEAGASGASEESEDAFESIETECKVCMHAPKSHLFVPCGHMCVCSSCATIVMANTKMCPICCTPASHVVRLFL